MDCIVFLGTVQTSSITTALTPKIGLGENHVCTRGLSAIEILIFWYWDHFFEITAIVALFIWPNLQMDFQFDVHSNFQLSGENPTTKAVQSRFGILISWNSSSDIHTFSFNLLICSPQFIRYRLRKNNSLKVWTFHCCKNVLEIGFAFKYWSIMRKCSGPAWGESLCCSM